MKMAVSGKEDSRRPLLTSKEEFYLRDELWRCKCPTRRAEIHEELDRIDEIRLTTNRGQQTDL